MAVNAPEKVGHQEKHDGVKFSWIPEELKREKRWVNWKYVPRKGEPEKFEKKPINPATGAAASATDNTTWSTFQVAVRRFKQGNVDGIGFVLAPAPESTLTIT
jgi:putative DNA primase/helicase